MMTEFQIYHVNVLSFANNFQRTMREMGENYRGGGGCRSGGKIIAGRGVSTA